MEHCFISGPITADKDYLEHFRLAEGEVKSLGFQPVNPAALSKPLLESGVNFSHDEWMEIDLTVLKQCSRIYLLKGWDFSPGSVEEFEYAKEYGYKIYFQENLEIYLRMKELL